MNALPRLTSTLRSASTRRGLLSLALGFLALALAPRIHADPPNKGDGIGSTEKNEAALIGTLYDLKKTMKQEPAISKSKDYDDVLAQFITKGWDETILNKYYRFSQPLYTTQVYIPMISDRAAPKAFGVDNFIKDGYWIVHYKGQVMPPSAGRYRFAGYAHATMFVAVNGKLVLNGCAFDINKTAMKDFPLESTHRVAGGPKAGAPAGDGILTLGEWFDCKEGEPVDIDILFGNRVFLILCAFVLVEKEGEKYDINPATGFPILPLFQISRYEGGELLQDSTGTPVKVNASIWKGVQ